MKYLKHLLIGLIGFILSLLLASLIFQLNTEIWGYGVYSLSSIYLPVLGFSLLSAWFMVFYKKTHQPRLFRNFFQSHLQW